MYLPESFSISLFLLVLSMICWGSWANAFNLCRGKYRFELFYWDYAIGVLLASLAYYATMGPGIVGLLEFNPNANFGWAILAGVVFNFGNVFLVAAISITGLAVAFPVCIGLALLLGVGLSWWISPQISGLPLVVGSLLLLLAMVLDAAAYRTLTRDSVFSARGVVIAVIGGLFMGAFPPSLQKAMLGPAALDSYSASLMLAVGIFLCSLSTNWIFMRWPIAGGTSIGMEGYYRAPLHYHLLGIGGGVIWVSGLVFNAIAARNVSVAVSYACGTGATLVAALWGVWVWKEFRGASAKCYWFLAGMFVAFLSGIVIIAWAKMNS